MSNNNGVRTVAAVRPAKIVLLDGKERLFLLKRGEMEKLKAKLGVETDQDLLNFDTGKLCGPLLVAAHRGDDLTDENIGDLIPVDFEWCREAILTVIGVSLPDRPTAAPENPTPQ